MDTAAFATRSCRMLATAAVGLPLGAAIPAAYADVTVQQQMTFEVSVVKAHSSSTELTAADKQRRDSETHCDGFMALVCGKAGSGEIVRLDRDVEWQLDPKKKEYRETHLPTPAETAAAEAQASAALETLKHCPAIQQPAAGNAPDTTRCEMSPAKVEAHRTDLHAVFAGHDARLSRLSLTQSCRNVDTGDTCDIVISMDSWLTEETIAGLDDRRVFQEAYARKLGLDGSSAQLQQQFQQFLAPYQAALKQLSSKAGDFQGFPLKTQVRISFGGPLCAAARNAASASGGGSAGGTGGDAVGDAGTAAGQAAAGSATSATGAAAGQAAANAAGGGAGGSIFGSAAGAFGSKLASSIAGGLFAKKKTAAAASASAPASASGSAPGPASGSTPSVPSVPLGPNMIQVAQISTETTSIDPAPIPPEQFDIPPGWKRVVPKQRPAAREVSCPKPAS